MGKIAQKHQTVEDAILYFAGVHRVYANTTHKPSPYDKAFIFGIARSINTGERLTAKQGKAALSVIYKYRRQLTNAGFDIDRIYKEQKFRQKPPEDLGEKKRVFISPATTIGGSQTHVIVFQMEYDRHLIHELDTYTNAASQQLKVGWSRDLRGVVWFCKAEAVLCAVDFAKKYDFEIDPELITIAEYIEANREDQINSSISYADGKVYLHTDDQSLINILDERYNVHERT